MFGEVLSEYPRYTHKLKLNTVFTTNVAFSLCHVRFDETRLFLGYSLYGWGVPLALLVLTATMHFLPEGYAVLRPHFGVNTCWFHGKAYNFLKTLFSS